MRPGSEMRRGYTMLEIIIVLIVVAIVGVVLSLAAVDVLNSNENRRAETNANSVLLAQRDYARKFGSFTDTPADLGRFDDYDVVTGVSGNPDEVSIAVGSNGTLGVAVRMDSETCVLWRAADLASGGGSKRLGGNGSSCRGSDAIPAGESDSSSSSGPTSD